MAMDLARMPGLREGLQDQAQIMVHGLINDQNEWIRRGVELMLGTTFLTAIRQKAPQQFANLLRMLSRGNRAEALDIAARMATPATWATSFVLFVSVYTLINVADRCYNSLDFDMEWQTLCKRVSQTWKHATMGLHVKLFQIVKSVMCFCGNEMLVAVCDIAKSAWSTFYTGVSFALSPFTGDFRVPNTFVQVLQELIDWISELLQRARAGAAAVAVICLNLKSTLHQITTGMGHYVFPIAL